MHICKFRHFFKGPLSQKLEESGTPITLVHVVNLKEAMQLRYGKLF